MKHQKIKQLKDTLILSLFTQLMQHEIIQKNIILKTQLYKVHLHNYNTLIH